MSRWWRCYEGAPFDPKWRLVAAKVGGRPGDVWAVVSVVYDYASKNEGCVDGIDLEEVAISLGYETEYVTAVTVTLRDRNIIVDDRVSAWDKRQYKDDSAPRVKAFRERQKHNKNKGKAQSVTDVTAGSVTRNGETPSDTEQNRADKEDIITDAPKLTLSTAHIEVANEILRIVRKTYDDKDWFGLMERARQWIAAGWSPEGIIFPACKKYMLDHGGNSPPSRKYLEKVIQSYADDLAKPLPEIANVNGTRTSKPAKPTEESDRRAILAKFGFADGGGGMEPDADSAGIVVEGDFGASH